MGKIDREHFTYQEDIDQAVAIMKRGGVILYPTDTVWGIGCDATNEEAVARIYAIKQRSDSKSMLVLVDSVSSLERIVQEVPEVAYSLIELAVKPITIIYDQGVGLAHNLLAEDGSIGVRVSRETFSRQLARAMRRPIVSTSANISGSPTPMFFSAISPEVINQVDYVVRYRQDDEKEYAPSQIIKLSTNGLVKVIRP